MSNELNIEKIKNSSSDVILKAKVITGAKKNAIEFLDNNEIKLKIAQIAVEGKANKEIISFLSEIFDVAKSRIKILRGEKSNHKSILIEVK